MTNNPNHPLCSTGSGELLCLLSTGDTIVKITKTPWPKRCWMHKKAGKKASDIVLNIILIYVAVILWSFLCQTLKLVHLRQILSNKRLISCGISSLIFIKIKTKKICANFEVSENGYPFNTWPFRFLISGIYTLHGYSTVQNRRIATFLNFRKK